MGPLRLAGAVVIAMAVSLVVGRARQAPSEYDVKAAFLLNFARYVQWPASPPGQPFRLCVLGTNPFGRRLESVIGGEQWRGGRIELISAPTVRDARDCHLLYVPASVTDHFVAAAADLARRPVLTVGETRAFLGRGGIIQLFVEDGKVRFSINRQAADNAHLQVSSRLLRLARIVIQGTAQ
ncbi:MAG TPA: YfiR family protein [Vicinamibacterales bacterium]|nr:YfiR family protein [Vicinamibacterales bacterium]